MFVLVGLQYQKWKTLCRVDVKYNQKVVGYTYKIHTMIVQLGAFCQAGQ